MDISAPIVRWTRRAAIALVLFFPFSQAVAQFGPRSTMVSSGGEGEPSSFLSFAFADLRVLTAPEVTHADLPDAMRILSLSQEQADAIGVMIDAYLARLAEIEWDRALVERGPGASRDMPQAPDPRGPERIIDDILRASGVDPARLRDGDLQMSVGVSVSRQREEDRSESPPQVHVSVELGPREGVTISAAERKVLEEAAEQIADAIGKSAMQRSQGSYEPGGPPPADVEGPEDFQARLRSDIERIHAAIEVYRRAKLVPRAQFVAEVQSILAEPQIESWPIFDRLLRRRLQIPRGILSAESVDLVALAATVAADSESSWTAEAKSALLSYELELDTALLVRTPILDRVDAAIDRALLASDAARVIREIDSAMSACIRVRDVNLRALDMLVQADPELGPVLRDRVMAFAFEPARQESLAGRAFDLLSARTDLDAELLAGVEGMRQVWTAEWREAQDAVVRAIVRYEPEAHRSSLRELIEMIDPARAARLDPGPDLVLQARQRAAAIDVRTLRDVRSVVGPEIAAILPEAADGSLDPMIRAERSSDDVVREN